MSNIPQRKTDDNYIDLGLDKYTGTADILSMGVVTLSLLTDEYDEYNEYNEYVVFNQKTKVTVYQGVELFTALETMQAEARAWAIACETKYAQDIIKGTGIILPSNDIIVQ